MNAIELMVQRTVVCCVIDILRTSTRDYGIRMSKKRTVLPCSNKYNVKNLGELGDSKLSGSNKSWVSNRSLGLQLEEIWYMRYILYSTPHFTLLIPMQHTMSKITNSNNRTDGYNTGNVK